MSKRFAKRIRERVSAGLYAKEEIGKEGLYMIFDSHAHYDDSRFDEDREELLSSLYEHGIKKVINVCSDPASIGDVLEYVKKYRGIEEYKGFPVFYGAVGIHPSETEKLEEKDFDYLKTAASHDGIVAVGEIGLDYYYDEPEAKVQKKWFRLQLELAEELELPVIIHSRNACQDTLEILRERKDVTGVIHCFSYTKETAEEYLKMGYYIGVGGVVTFKNAKKLKEAVEVIPMDRILLETDCPYLTPEPHRGTRNSSLMIPYIIEEIARIKRLEPAQVEETAWENTHRLFRIAETAGKRFGTEKSKIFQSAI